jgi:hypothetical protein
VPIDHDPDHWYYGTEGHMHHPAQVAMRAAHRRGERRSAVKPADEILLEAEREIEQLIALPSIKGNIPAERCHAWNDRRRFIISTKAVGLIGAAVKLRQLIHPDLGIGDSCPDDVALARDALAVIDRMIATS